MAGKRGRSGRRPKPDAVKLAAGTYRYSDSGDPEEKPEADGAPQKPVFASVHASELWDKTVTELVAMQVAARIDSALLRSMCELWGLYRISYEIAESDPTDKDARIAVVAYWAKFEQAAARFGMNPSDRGRLRIEKPKEPAIPARQRG